MNADRTTPTAFAPEDIDNININNMLHDIAALYRVWSFDFIGVPVKRVLTDVSAFIGAFYLLWRSKQRMRSSLLSYSLWLRPALRCTLRCSITIAPQVTLSRSRRADQMQSLRGKVVLVISGPRIARSAQGNADSEDLQ